MQLEQAFVLPRPPAAAWPAFKDIELLVACLPGASLTGPAVDGEVPLRFDVKLGPIAAGFAGAGRVSFDDAAQAGRFEGQAADKRTGSRVKGAATFALRPHEAGTQVLVTVDYSLTGTLAQFSRGAIVRELASALTAQFAANLAASPASAPAAPASGADGHATGPAERQPAQTAPLSVWSLLRQMLAARWERLWRRPRAPRSP